MTFQQWSRRNFIKNSAFALSAAMMQPMGFAQDNNNQDDNNQGDGSGLPDPSKSGIEHVVLAMMENRSFDHLLGWLPNANGAQAGLRYPDRAGVLQPTWHLTDYQNCGFNDPDHSYTAGRVEFDNGRCDGWLRAGNNDRLAIGYYTQRDLAFLGQAAPQWTVCDRYFAAIMSETYPNRIYQHAAQTDRITNTTDLSLLPTLWDLLGLDSRYYFSDIPLLALWGPKYLAISRPFSEFKADCAAGTLPKVSFVDPRFLAENEGLSNDDHPHADIRNGEVFLNEVYNAVTKSPAWKNTLLIVSFDEWGGFFDHVPPPLRPIPPASAAAGDQDGRLGFRVPALLISPWSRGHRVSSIPFDHTSVLKLLEWRWNLPPLTVRDQTANNLALALDFSHTKLAADSYNVPPGPFGTFCVPGLAPSAPVSTSNEENWAGIQDLAQRFGFPVP